MTPVVPAEEVGEALGLGRHEHVAIVGGGGKTTLLHALGASLVGSTVVTCTTKMGHDQHRGLPVLLDPSDDEIVAAATETPVMVWKRISGQKAVGVDPSACDRWFERVDHVVSEADGSRQRPFKAPAGFEPVVGATVTRMISVIGADALGRVIADQCHRPLRVAALADCSPYVRLSPEAAATVILHERGARKELPVGAELSVVVTKVDDRSRELVEALVATLTALEAAVRVVLVPARRA